VSVLRNLESKLAGLVEGTFSRAFKSEVRPVEIARKLAREMDEHRVQSLSRTYVPNEYAVWLSPDDRKQFEGYEDELKRELAGYLLEHARRERIALVTAPEARPYVRMVIERLFPTLPVLSHVEIARGVEIKVLGTIS
jgi:flagellar biosynthesis component FlhA